MRLGGFVIHGNAERTLEPCLASLTATCHRVVAVDSGATDGSAGLVRRSGVEAVSFPWRGYGAARAAAARALAGCDYLFFLDSDERLMPASIEALRAFRESRPSAEKCVVTIRDWAAPGKRRFVYRTEHHVRLVRADRATWSEDQVVHESLSRRGAAKLPAVVVEHEFVTELGLRRDKLRRYALLWALKAALGSQGWKPPWLQRLAHFGRDLLVRGAIFRGGLDAARIAWAVSGYHADKYSYLTEVRRGGHARLLKLLRERRLDALFAELAARETP